MDRSLRPVTVALADGDRTALTAGVEPGERVVVDGQQRLKEGPRFREPQPPQSPPAAPKSAPVAQGERS